MATQLTPIRKADGGSPGAGPLSPPDSQCDPCKMDDFAELLCEFYELLVEMAYLPHGSIVYAPHTAVAPRITKREVVRQGLDPRIAPLIQKIPYIDVSISAQCDIIPNSVLVVYGIYQAMEDSRDPLRVNRDIGNTDAYLEKWVAPIFVSNSDGTGTNLLFDTRTGDVIVWKRVDPPSTFSPFRRPPFYYRDYPTLPATEYVAELIEEFRTLQLVPWNKVIIEPSDPLFPYVKYIYERCGWPKSFKKPRFRILRDRFTKWLDAHYAEFDSLVNDSNRATHFEENCERVFEDAGIQWKERRDFGIRSLEDEAIQGGEQGEGFDEGGGNQEQKEQVDEPVNWAGDVDLNVDRDVDGDVDGDVELDDEPRRYNSRLRGGTQTLWGPLR